jgi:hypothetical protein
MVAVEAEDRVDRVEDAAYACADRAVQTRVAAQAYGATHDGHS